MEKKFDSIVPWYESESYYYSWGADEPTTIQRFKFLQLKK